MATFKVCLKANAEHLKDFVCLCTIYEMASKHKIYLHKSGADGADEERGKQNNKVLIERGAFATVKVRNNRRLNKY